MANQEPTAGILGSLKCTNILLTIIALTLILAATCMHINKEKYCHKSKKGMVGSTSKRLCPIPAQDTAPVK